MLRNSKIQIMALTQYDLSRSFWDFAFENPEKVKPTHIAIFFFAMEHCNRLGWKEKFGLPSSMVIEAIGLKSYNSYIKYLNDLAEWGAIKIIEYSKNQYSSNIISLSNALSKNVKALDKALVGHTSKHEVKQLQSTSESKGSIDKPITIEPITNNNDYVVTPPIDGFRSLESLKDIISKDDHYTYLIVQKGVKREDVPKWYDAFNRRLSMLSVKLKQERDYRAHFPRWLVKIPGYTTMNPDHYNPAGNTVEVNSNLTDADKELIKLMKNGK
jgi:hypothetical protein